MNSIEIGKFIANNRKEAGYTQKELAHLLHVTDKAISKWERGLSLPDSLILPKLSMLLDIDIEHLIPNQLFSKSSNWQGLLIIDENKASTMLYDKPLINYLLSYFLLVGITNITIKGCSNNYIDSLKLEKYGINTNANNNCLNTMAIYDNFLLVCSNLTRVFKSYMDDSKDIRVYLDGKELPLLFVHNKLDNIDFIRRNAEMRVLSRGSIGILLNNKKQIKEASKLIEIYQQNSKYKIADLNEIANNRGLI